MTPEEIKESIEKVKSMKKPVEPQMVSVSILLNRYSRLILTKDKALKLMDALESAYEFEENYGKPPTFHQLNNGFEFTFLSGKEFEMIQTAKILNVPVEEIKGAFK